MIHGSTERLLVATASREVVEVRNKIKPPTPEELAEAAEAAAAAAEAAAAAAALTRLLVESIREGLITEREF